MFQYATPETLQSIQAQLESYFDTTISSRAQLIEQLGKSLQLLKVSSREIVHTLAQSHIKALVATKHHLFQTEDMIRLGMSKLIDSSIIGSSVQCVRQ
jgi:arsenate reductase-like glutaredoxin family protein